MLCNTFVYHKRKAFKVKQLKYIVNEIKHAFSRRELMSKDLLLSSLLTVIH